MSAFDNIDDLIGKVLAHEATAPEREELNQWIQQSEENARYFRQLKTLFEKAAASRVKLRFDEDEAWQKVKSKIEKKKKQVFLSPAIIRIAAGLVLVAVVSYFIYQSGPAEQTLAIKTERETRQDTLPDGSMAFVNKNSRVDYEFTSKEKKRKVKLTGEAYFEVKHEETKPFVIEATDEVLIQDIGTAFNVKAYPNSDTVVVTVESGEVQFYTLKNPGLRLKAGEAGIYRKSIKEFSKLIKADTNVLAYKTKIFNFRDTDLRKAVEMINEIYDSKIKLGNSAIGACRLTVNFNNDKVEDIADIIAETLGLKMEKKGDGFILNGAGCLK
ncbi:anti-sigma factor [Cytophagales bacterium WSM2-2]|nr:anti-sigma factor [Cytophagales bacterium WSM2-2]